MHANADPFDRIPPHSIEAEMCLLGAMMLDAGARAEALRVVDRADFCSADHEIIFSVLGEMHRAGGAVDAVTVREELIRRQLFDEVGGMPYLAKILGATPAAAHAGHYAAIVREKAALRNLIALSNDTLAMAYGPGAESAEINQRLIDRASELHATGRTSEAVSLEDALHEVYEEATGEGVPLHPLPFEFLNDWLGGGVADGEFVIVAGWPSHGKSALCKQCGEFLAGKGLPGGIVTLEESKKKIARNLLAAESGIDNKVIRHGRVNPALADRLAGAIAKLARRRIYIHEKAMTLAQVTTAVDIGVAKQGWKWAVIDHLDLIDVSSIDAKNDTAAHTRISGTIKQLAKRLNIPVFAVKQLVKPDGNVIRRPKPSDLRNSGAYQADCDVLILVNSEDVHRRDDPEWVRTGLTDVIVAKAREGTGGVRRVLWNGTIQRYAEVADQRHEAAAATRYPDDPFSN